MKRTPWILLIVISLAACSPTASAQGTSNTAIPPAMPIITTVQPAATNADDEASVKNLVESFGKRLQNVSLLAANAAQQMQTQYSDLVSPALLQTWTSNVSKAPGRAVSSPWPDRIEITTLSKENTDRYVVTGFVIEITSVEMVNGGAADKIPVRMVVENNQGRWLITEFSESK